MHVNTPPEQVYEHLTRVTGHRHLDGRLRPARVQARWPVPPRHQRSAGPRPLPGSRPRAGCSAAGATATPTTCRPAPAPSRSGSSPTAAPASTSSTATSLPANSPGTPAAGTRLPPRLQLAAQAATPAPDPVPRRQRSPQPGIATGDARRTRATVHQASRQNWPFLCRSATSESVINGGAYSAGRSGKPGPNQGPTQPDFARRSETSPDIKVALECGNRTQRDVIRRNRHAWHAEGQGFESP